MAIIQILGDTRRTRRTPKGVVIAIAVGAVLAAVATWVPQTGPYLLTAVLCLALLLGMLAAIPRGR
jgi:uncharacterized membrane protein YgaE (UPF0421/DUF939 family)